MSNKKGVMIVLEGLDFSGKTSALSYVRDAILGLNYPTINTRGLGGSPIAEVIRESFFKCADMPTEKLLSKTELLLVSAARVQHLENTIKPALENGVWVLCDRFNDSTWAYQRSGAGCNSDYLHDLEDMVLETFSPDVVILLDADPRALIGRDLGRNDNNVFDEKDMEFKDRVREGFLKRVKRNCKTRYFIIDATKTPDEVKKECEEVVHWIHSTLSSGIEIQKWSDGPVFLNKKESTDDNTYLEFDDYSH